MKNFKKFAGLVLAMVMALSMAVTAFAAEGTSTTYTIEITGAVSGETYTAYKMFNLSWDGEDAYTYTVAADWEAFFAEDGAGAAYVTIEGGYVTAVDETTIAAFAKAALAYAEENEIEAAASEKAVEGEAVLKVSEMGYYVVSTTLGTVCSLDTVTTTVEIAEKNIQPTIKKTVEEASTEEYGETNTADFGDVVYFKAVIKNVAAVKNLVMHDTMDAGLIFTGSVDVTLKEVGGESLEKGYTLVTDPEDDCTFEIVFDQDFIDSLDKDAVIYVYYSARVDVTAVVGGDGNTNTTYVSFGDDQVSVDSETVTYVYGFDIFKYTEKNDEEVALENAKFILYKKVATEEGGEVTWYAKITNDMLTGWTTNKDVATTLTSDADGMIYIAGLDADTYYLEETDAPAGYNKLSDVIEVVIDEDGTVNGNEDTNTIKVLNSSGSILPSTGGIGTTIFYVVGIILMLGAAVLLITKKRMERAE